MIPDFPNRRKTSVSGSSLDLVPRSGREEYEKHADQINKFLHTPAGEWFWQFLMLGRPERPKEIIPALYSSNRWLTSDLNYIIDVLIEQMADKDGISFLEEKILVCSNFQIRLQTGRGFRESLRVDSPFERFLSLESVRQITDYSHEALLEFIQSGELHAEKWGEDYRVPSSSLQDFIEMRRRQTTPRRKKSKAESKNTT